MKMKAYADFDAYLADRGPGQKAIIRKLRAFVKKTAPSLDEAVKSAASDRLVVSSAVGLFAELPASYREGLLEIDGVKSVNRWSWFGGVYKDPKNFFPRMGVDLETLLAQYPEIVVPADQRAALLAERRACLVGTGLVQKFGIAVGDTVEKGQRLVILEAMKMQHEMVAAIAGRLAQVMVKPGDQVATRQVLAVVEPPAGPRTDR